VSTGLVAGLLCLTRAGTAVAGPANVTVRVEGAAATLLPKKAVTTTTVPVSRDGDPAHSCAGTTAIGALHLATNGDWNGQWSFSQTVETILGESHVFDAEAAANQYWTFWRNYEYSHEGACTAELQEGDEVLFFPGCFGECTEPAPLRLVVPGRARPGESVAATVTEYTVEFDANYAGTAKPRPSSGATVSAGGRTFTTDAQGVARVVLDARGPAGVQATKSGFVRSATEPLCVTDGADGFCDTLKPPPPCVHDGDDGRCGTRDRKAAQARFTGLPEGAVFARGAAPRELRGTVSADPSGLFAVKLRLSRRYHGRCQYLSGRLERMRDTRCGRSFWLRIGDRADWSYLLPSALGPGRYVLDVIAIDKAFNRDVLARGRNRVVFEVT
jgi:hypothetical protein